MNYLLSGILSFTIFATISCSKSTLPNPTTVVPPSPPGTLIDPTTLKGSLMFQSNFEIPCSIVPNSSTTEKIIGKDALLGTNNSWDALSGSILSSQPYFNYNGGDLSKRSASLVQDPLNASNKVLLYNINDSWADASGTVKARVQYEFYGVKSGLKEYYQSVRMFLPTDLNLLRKYPNTINWLTIVEIWNNITWSQAVPFGYRLTVGIGKLIPTEDDLHFIVDAQDCILYPDNSQKYTTIWSANAGNVKIPVGQWFTMDYYFKEGNAKSGRFYMTIEPEGGKKEVVFDVTNFTHNTTDPSPDGVTQFNPMKLYTSKELVAYMKNQGKSLQIFWDDFKLWRK
jgi:hypothetical protein